MFRALIVDDDFLARKYLETLDSWERSGYEIVASLQDGKEAIEFLKNNSVDTIITDISMPVMDGIKFIEEFRKNDTTTYLTVLSCHDEFEYVKEAMRFGANEYILKNTIDENIIYNILEGSKKHIEKIKKKSVEDINNKELIRMGTHILKSNYFNGVLSGALKGEEKVKAREEAYIKGKFVNSAVFFISTLYWNRKFSLITNAEQEQYSHSFRHRLLKYLDNIIGEESEYIEIIYVGNGLFSGFIDLSYMHKTSHMQQQLNKITSLVFKFCQNEEYDYGVYISDICIGEDGIKQAYNQARQVYKLNFYYNDGVIYYDVNKKISENMPLCADELLKKLELVGNNISKDELEEELLKIADECESNIVDKNAIIQFIIALDKVFDIERDIEFYIDINNIDCVRVIFKNYVDLLSNKDDDVLPDNINPSIITALKFINSNYKSQISLQDVADFVGINGAYLSYIFKQEMNIGFANYIQERRMKCAKNLLKNTNSKIKDVAIQSGFNDYHYFSKIFKKLEGCSPAEYRKISIKKL